MNKEQLITLKREICWKNAKNNSIVEYCERLIDEIDETALNNNNNLYQIFVRSALIDINICCFKISNNKYYCKNVRDNIKEMYEICDIIETYL